VLAILLGVTFVALQLVVLFPVVGVAVAQQPFATEEELRAVLEEFLRSEPGLLLAVLAAAIAGVGTVGLAFAWPRMWNLAAKGARFNVGDWLAWRRPERLRLWLVPLITLPLLLAIAYGVNATFGNVQVDQQLLLFSSPALSVVSALVVSFIAPIAEEVVFRGALYNALLRRASAGGWQRHIIAFVVTSLAFAMLHLLAGFEQFGSILMITLFSVYLTALRAYTGSIQSSVVAHMVWNMIGSAALILANVMGIAP
jgi:membrane protease YdiL (CAAX protease family)